VQKRFHLVKFGDGAALAQAIIRRSGLEPVERAVFENGEL
jgi:hypothetical protein